MYLFSIHIRNWFICVCLIVYSGETIYAQSKTQPSSDSSFFLAHKKGLLGKIGKSLSVNAAPPALPARGVIKNESAFNQYKGKIIRNIHIQKLGFNRSVNDTSRNDRNVFNDIGDALHPSTATKVILNNLFFSAGDTLYPYLLADNERYLRNLSYLQDARISIQEDPDSKDSVDVIILCKDVFPVGGSLDEGTEKSASFELNDDNLLGTANRIQIKNFFDATRNPKYGLGFEFMKRNLGGSFLNLTIGYENEAPAFNSGRREEKALYLRGDLPLVSPYHEWTGAFEIADHYTQNVYLSDSLYKANYQYSYKNYDGWIGYNIGARKQLQQNFKSRLKRLIALRLVDKNFSVLPQYFQNNYQINYNNLTAALGSYTIFEQDFYHTNFIYGFGRNEDVPEGFSIAFTGGWTSINHVSRPYIGFDYQRNYFSNKNNYFNYAIRFGTYYNNGRLEDISGLTSLEYFTKLRKLGNSRWFLRHFISGSVTQLAHTYLNQPLLLSSDYGIPQLPNPNFLASTRATINGSSVFYNTWKLVGFSFAPFSFANFTYLKTQGKDFQTGDIFMAIGGGVRTRNENLVFGTIELKAYYYPRTTTNTNQWNITVNSNIIFKYNSQLINRPDFIKVN